MSRDISESEWRAEKRRDGNLSWKEITDEALTECEAGLAHLIEDSFTYYLGAFLSFATRHLEAEVFDREWGLVGTVVFSVTDTSNYNLSRLKNLSDKQIACVIQFLQLVVEHSDLHRNDARTALEKYWLTPESRTKGIVHVPHRYNR